MDIAEDDLEAQLPLSAPVYRILLAIGSDVMHGYAIMQSFRELTEGEEELLPGTLYATLARMVESGALESVPATADSSDGRRRYYRATDAGRALARAESARLRRLLDIAAQQGLVAGGHA